MSEMNKLEIIRNFSTTPERLYDAWTDPEQVVKWFGPEGVTIGEHSFDSRPGGAWRTEFCGDGGSRHYATGTYKTLDRPNKMVTSWCWQFDGEPGEVTELTIEIRPTPDGAQLTLTHERFAQADTRDQHFGGWTSAITSLENYIAT